MATVPNPPIINSIVPGIGQAKINFTAPAFDGGRPIFNYTVTANPGNITTSGINSPITIFGLTSGQIYTISLVASNNLGNSTAATISQYNLPLLVNTTADLQAAVDVIAADGIVLTQMGTGTLAFPPLTITKDVTISGGYNPDFSAVSGYTTIPGRVNIKGTLATPVIKVIFKNIKIL